MRKHGTAALVLMGWAAFAGPAAAAGACPGRDFADADVPPGTTVELAYALPVRQFLGATLPAAFDYKFTQIGSVLKPCGFTDAAWEKFRDRARLAEYEGQVHKMLGIGNAVLGEPPTIKRHARTAGGVETFSVSVDVVPSWQVVADRFTAPVRRADLVLRKDVDADGVPTLRIVDVE